MISFSPLINHAIFSGGLHTTESLSLYTLIFTLEKQQQKKNYEKTRLKMEFSWMFRVLAGSENETLILPENVAHSVAMSVENSTAMAPVSL